jgi:heat shock protein HslJ
MSQQNTRILTPLLLITAISLIIGCSSRQEQPSATEPTASSLPDPLANTHWQAVRIYENQADAAASTLLFGPETNVSGNAGCNNFNGQVTRTGTSIDFGLLATTRKMCEPATSGQERAFLEALDSVVIWRRIGGQLEFVDAEGAVVISLREFKS